MNDSLDDFLKAYSEQLGTYTSEEKVCIYNIWIDHVDIDESILMYECL